jgi:hypothetical protein
MYPLDERMRRHMLAAAAVLCAVPAVLAPMAARSSLASLRENTALSERFAAPLPTLQWRSRVVRVTRDPFAGDAGNDTIKEPASRPLVPQTSFLEAVATGGEPRALVQDGSEARVVGIGDVLDGSRVVAIDSKMVRLANGAVLLLAPGSP